VETDVSFDVFLMSFEKPIKGLLLHIQANRGRHSVKQQIETKAGYFDSAACDLNAFAALIDQTVMPSSVPNADDIQKNVPQYDMSRLGSAPGRGVIPTVARAEWSLA
jgi:hypothetical protein